LQRLGGWLILTVFIASALHQLGFKLSVVLGAAGIFSVAVGFAAQTSAANIISGLFVIGERSFIVGDIIQAGNHTGEVLSVDMLSVKLRTFDNRFVRIPNETIIKTDVVNLSRFPIRRADIKVSISYNSNIAKAREILLRVAENNPFCLEEPRPLVNLQGFGESSVDIQFSIWSARENFADIRDTLHEEIKVAFDAAGIEFPFPTRTLHIANADFSMAPRSNLASRDVSIARDAGDSKHDA
jgi:small-conductance mechanosensitive channel